MAYKVFTNGSVLNASEINDNLMNQSVMVFSNSTARSAALPSPLEGMLTWLEDVNRYEYRNGAGAWVALSEAGVNLVASQSFSAATAVNIDNVFSATYNTYQMVISATASVTGNPQFRFRVGGVAATTNYSDQYVQASGTSTSALRNTGLTRIYLGGWGTSGGLVTATFHGVALAQATMGVAQVMQPATITTSAVGFTHSTATAYDGIGLIFDGSTTGEVRIYGLRNS